MLPRLLIVEDDGPIASNLFTWFEHKRFDVDLVHSGSAALRALAARRFEVVLLDIGLPGADGLAVLQSLRCQLRIATPVLLLTARSDLGDKLAGFEHGADDYVTKPFALAEVEARVRSLLSRSRGDPMRFDAVLRFGTIEFDTLRHETRLAGRTVRLAPKPARLLALLMRRPGELVSRSELEQSLWPDEVPNADALRGQVHFLRRALAEAGIDAVETVHGVGYRLMRQTSP